MGCDEGQFREALLELIGSLQSAYASLDKQGGEKTPE
jgi:hypothetical protein